MKILATLCASILIFAAAADHLIAQSINSDSYSVYTYVIVGSNEKNDDGRLSDALQNSLRNISDEFGYTKFRIISTHFQNVKRDGIVSYNSFLKGNVLITGQEDPIFASFSLNKFYKSDSPDSNTFGFRSFGFKARFPVVSKRVSKEGKSAEIVNYESVGTNSRDVEVNLSQPTLISSLPIGERAFFFVAKIERN